MVNTCTMRRSTLGLLALLALSLTHLLGLPSGRAAGDDVAVIVGAKCTVSDMSLDDLSRLYRGTPARNSDGHRFVPLNQPPESPIRIAFDQKVLGFTPDQAKSFWIDQKIRAAGSEPRVISSVALTVKLVSVLSGAVAYVPASAVTMGVKIVKIEGRLPGQPGYPLH